MNKCESLKSIGSMARYTAVVAVAAAVCVCSIFHSGFFMCKLFFLLFLLKMITSIVMHALSFAFSSFWKTHFSTFNLTKKLLEPFRIIVRLNNNKANVYSSLRSDSFHFMLFDFTIDFSPTSNPTSKYQPLTANLCPNNRSQYYTSQLTLCYEWLATELRHARMHAEMQRREAGERARCLRYSFKYMHINPLAYMYIYNAQIRYQFNVIKMQN